MNSRWFFVSLTVSIVLGLFLITVGVAGAQGLISGEPGDVVVFIETGDIPNDSVCTVLFENNESSHPGNVAIARSSLEREIEADFENGNGETVELVIESDGLLFAGVRLGETGGTSTAVEFFCEQKPPPTTTTSVPPPETTTPPPVTTVPEPCPDDGLACTGGSNDPEILVALAIGLIGVGLWTRMFTPTGHL